MLKIYLRSVPNQCLARLGAWRESHHCCFGCPPHQQNQVTLHQGIGAPRATHSLLPCTAVWNESRDVRVEWWKEEAEADEWSVGLTLTCLFHFSGLHYWAMQSNNLNANLMKILCWDILIKAPNDTILHHPCVASLVRQEQRQVQTKPLPDPNIPEL